MDEGTWQSPRRPAQNFASGRRVFLSRAGSAALVAAALRTKGGFAQGAQESAQQSAKELAQQAAQQAAPPGGAGAGCGSGRHGAGGAEFRRYRGAQDQGPRRRLRLSSPHLRQPVSIRPAASVADNRVTLDALGTFGDNARGVAIVYPAITDAELKTLSDAGVRGIRFSLAAAGSSPAIPSAMAETIETLAKRVNTLGWHVQLNIDATQIVAIEDLLNRLAAPIVFDHMGHMPQPAGIDHPAYRIVRRLIDNGRTWVKLSVICGREQGRPSLCPAAPMSPRCRRWPAKPMTASRFPRSSPMSPA
jgi:hypothetical protein